MFNDTSIHGVKKITARTFEDLESTPLIIRFTGKDGEDAAEITLHTYNKALSLALVAAINKVDEDRQESKVTDAATIYPPADEEIEF